MSSPNSPNRVRVQGLVRTSNQPSCDMVAFPPMQLDSGVSIRDPLCDEPSGDGSCLAQLWGFGLTRKACILRSFSLASLLCNSKPGTYRGGLLGCWQRVVASLLPLVDSTGLASSSGFLAVGFRLSAFGFRLRSVLEGGYVDSRGGGVDVDWARSLGGWPVDCHYPPAQILSIVSPTKPVHPRHTTSYVSPSLPPPLVLHT